MEGAFSLCGADGIGIYRIQKGKNGDQCQRMIAAAPTTASLFVLKPSLIFFQIFSLMFLHLLTSCFPDPRIKDSIQNICQKISEHHKKRGEHGNSHDQGIIILHDGSNCQLTDSRPCKTCSVIMAPDTRDCRLIPRTVIIGSMAFFSTCRKRIPDSFIP